MCGSFVDDKFSFANAILYCGKVLIVSKAKMCNVLQNENTHTYIPNECRTEDAPFVPFILRLRISPIEYDVRVQNQSHATFTQN